MYLKCWLRVRRFLKILPHMLQAVGLSLQRHGGIVTIIFLVRKISLLRALICFLFRSSLFLVYRIIDAVTSSWSRAFCSLNSASNSSSRSSMGWSLLILCLKGWYVQLTHKTFHNCITRCTIRYVTNVIKQPIN